MKVTKSINSAMPKYPSKRQFQKSGTILGVAAIGLGTLMTGCVCGKIVSKHEELEVNRTAGIMVVEPVQIGGAISVEPAQKDYVVKRGDTLYGIAKQAFGKGSRWSEIVTLNQGLRPDNLKAGQTIKLPVIIP